LKNNLRARDFKSGNFDDTKSLDQNSSGFSLANEEGKSASIY
jgi:hypothetical protein